jgi:hypothetical protein
MAAKEDANRKALLLEYGYRNWAIYGVVAITMLVGNRYDKILSRGQRL